MAILSTTLRSSLTFKVFFIALLILLLLIPMDMVEDRIRERSSQYRWANAEIIKIWGDSHQFTAPLLTIPRFALANENSGWMPSLAYQHLSPESLTINGVFDTQIRYRGIYKVPVYTAKISAQGRFTLPETTDIDIADEALLQIPFSKTKSLKLVPVLLWNGVALDLKAITDDKVPGSVIFQAAIPLSQIGAGEFRLVYETAGSSEFNVNSLAKQTRLTIESDWGSPGFQGGFFPVNYAIQQSGFTAEWIINNVFASVEDAGSENISAEQFKKNEMFGVKFIQLADTYQLVTRSAKYAVLFISLTFLVYFLVEVLGGRELHAIHYLLIGLSNCIFYLLLLSLSEHINFNFAYLLSASSSTLLISLYSRSVFQNNKRAVLVFTVLAGLYTYLFITLKSEDFALLSGSVGLFIIMSVFMYLTRNTNWHSLSLPEQPSQKNP